MTAIASCCWPWLKSSRPLLSGKTSLSGALPRRLRFQEISFLSRPLCSRVGGEAMLLLPEGAQPESCEHQRKRHSPNREPATTDKGCPRRAYPRHQRHTQRQTTQETTEMRHVVDAYRAWAKGGVEADREVQDRKLNYAPAQPFELDLRRS